MLDHASISLFSSGIAIDTHLVILLVLEVYNGTLLSNRTLWKLPKKPFQQHHSFFDVFSVFPESSRQIITGKHMEIGTLNEQELS